MNKIIGVGLLVAIVAGALFFTIGLKGSDDSSSSYTQLWEMKRYSEIIELGNSTLEKNPMDKNSLVFTGYAYFYQGINILSMKERNASIENSVFMLRRALLLEDKDDAPIMYILGKAYYHLGYYYTDLAIKYLEDARRGGCDAKDIDEYLGLAYERLAAVKKSS